MNEAPKVSIIVPVYKVPEKYLRACIESCQKQTLKEIEILLVADYDKEPDESTFVCREYEDKDSRIVAIEGIKNGLSAGRNKGYIEAKGKWIMFVDGDDWIEPDMCKTMYDLGEKHDVQLVMSGLYKDYNHSATKYHVCLEDERVYEGREECCWLQQQLLVYNSNIAIAYAKLIRKSYLDQYDIKHDEALKRGSEGLEFNIRLFEHLEKATYTEKPFYHYIYNDASFSAAPDDATHKYVLMSFERIKQSIQTSRNKDKLETWFDNRLLYVIVTTAISGYFSPLNKDTYNVRVKKFKRFMGNDMISGAIQTKNYDGVSFQRKTVLFFIKHKMYCCLEMMGKMRKWQKDHR